MYVDLLSVQFRWKRLWRTRVRQWGIATSLAFILLAAFYSNSFVYWYQSIQEIASLREEMEPVQAKLSEERRLMKNMEQVRSKVSQLQNLVHENHINSLLGMLGSSCQSELSPIWLKEVVMTPSQHKTSKPTSADPRTAESNFRLASMTVRGMAAEDVKLSDFIQQLEQFGVFASVELRTAHDTKLDGKSVQEFELECTHYE